AGAEDHYGDMDFKVAGTADGITALQMDIKVSGITTEVMTKALDQARRGRLHILDKMKEALPASRQNISTFAPRIVTIRIPVDEIMPGTDGLLHVSEIANHRVKDVRDELKEGEQLLVKVINIDPTGKIRLSRKALLQEEAATAAKKE